MRSYRIIECLLPLKNTCKSLIDFIRNEKLTSKNSFPQHLFTKIQPLNVYGLQSRIVLSANILSLLQENGPHMHIQAYII